MLHHFAALCGFSLSEPFVASTAAAFVTAILSQHKAFPPSLFLPPSLHPTCCCVAGAELANVMNEAALEAVRRNGSVVNMADIYNAMDRILQVTHAAQLCRRHASAACHRRAGCLCTSLCLTPSWVLHLQSEALQRHSLRLTDLRR